MRPKRASYRQTTLRDVQRGMARSLNAYWIGQALIDLGVQDNPWTMGEPENYQPYRPAIDRLVAKYGPTMLIRKLEKDAPLTSGEERKKETDEVAPASSQTSNEKHGGDGASGEVPDGHSTKGDADSRQVGDLPSEVDCPQEKGESGGSQELEEENGQGTADHSTHGAGQAALERVEETGREATPQASREQVEQGPAAMQDSVATPQHARDGESEAAHAEKSDTSDAGNDVSPADRAIREDDKALTRERELKQIGEEKREDASEIQSSCNLLKALKKADGKLSRSARTAHGGVFDDLARHKIDRAIVNQARPVLASWIADGADDEQSQRWDYPELAARLLTRRDPRPARRYEHGRPALLILADISGSCSGFSNQSLLVAKAIAAQGSVGANVVIVTHSNGCPEDVSVNNRPHPELLTGLEQEYYNASIYMTFYQKLAAQFGISHVIALGDHDAVDVYAVLATSAEIQSFVWLDNHGCNNYSPRLDAPTTTRAAKAAIRYVIGCKDATEFLRGLRVALR